MSWEKTGTVSVVQLTTTVNGTGTAFASTARAGDAFLGPDGRWYEVINVVSDVLLSIAPAYQGVTVARSGYSLAPLQGYVKSAADRLRTLVDEFGDKLGSMGTTGNYETLPISKGGTGAADSDSALSSLGALAKVGGTMKGTLNLAAPVSLASGAQIAIGAAAANTIVITGTEPITAFDAIAGGARRVLVFTGVLTLRYNAVSLILPGASDITTASGDVAEFESLGAGSWRCLTYSRAGQAPDVVRPIGQGGTGGASVEEARANLGIAPNPTVLINGNFSIWQRSASTTANGYKSVDRWAHYSAGTSHAVSRAPFAAGQASVPDNPKYFYRAVVSSVAGAANYSYFSQSLEDVGLLSGKTVTVSFWAQADTAKNVAIDFYQSFGTGGSGSLQAIGATKFTLSTSWQQYKFTVAMPGVSGKTLGTDHATVLRIWLDAGANHGSQSSGLGQQSGRFDFAQFKVEAGEIATAWYPRFPAEELALCLRYFETVQGTASLNQPTYYWHRYMVAKRAIPSLTVTAGTVSGASIESLSATGFRLIGSPTAASDFFIAADAEL